MLSAPCLAASGTACGFAQSRSRKRSDRPEHEHRTPRETRRRGIGAIALTIAALLPVASLKADDPVRPTAVVDLNFDEPSGDAADAAAAGTVKDVGKLVNGPKRLPSPFTPGGQAIRTDAAGKRFVRIDDSADLGHVGTTVSLFLVNLNELNAPGAYGIAAKRLPNGKGSRTNYGLNFAANSGRLQLYINDGGGFRIAAFPLAEAVGLRRRVHLTAAFGPGDAPGSDADADPDDLAIRLFVNGQPLKPIDATGGFVDGNTAWLPDVKADGLLNDAPLTIGASFPDNEVISAVIDDFLLFDRPLSDDEAARLFAEVAGPNPERFAADLAAAVSSGPTVADVTPRGLQVGATTRLTITGKSLGPDVAIVFPDAAWEAKVLPESTAERVLADVTVPSDALPTVTRLCVRTADGLSEPLPLPIERLPQTAFPAGTEPVTFPAAFTGRIDGSQQPRFVFDGRAGQRFVAAAELRRLGGEADAVLELKTAAGTPIAIAWGRIAFGGDPRLTATLPADGRYALELHDLAYKAAGSSFRILAGDLTTIDAILPPTCPPGASRPGLAFGPGIESGTIELRPAGDGTATPSGPAIAAAQTALPAVTLSPQAEFVEGLKDGPIDLTATPAAGISGRLAQPGETDAFAVRVQPGKPFTLGATAAFGSAVEPVLTVSEGGQQVGRAAAAPGKNTASLVVTPKSPDGLLEVRIADRLGGGGETAFYTLEFLAAGRSDARLTLLDPVVTLPSSGRGLVRLKIERLSPTGEVRLAAGPGFVLQPAAIPAGKGTEELFLTVAATGAAPSTLSLTAEVDSPAGPVAVPVRISPGTAVARYDAERPFFAAPVVALAGGPTLAITHPAAAAFKGTTAAIGVSVGAPPPGQVFRFSLVTNEPTRPIDPKKPDAGTQPRIALAEDSSASLGGDGAVSLVTPADVAVGSVDAVIKAEVVPHLWSNAIAGVSYSPPFRLTVRDPIAKLEPAGPATVKAGAAEVKATVTRTEGFTQPLRVELRGLPAGFAAPAVALAADQGEATLTVTVPADAAAGPVKDAELVVLSEDGTVLKSLKPFPLEVVK